MLGCGRPVGLILFAIFYGFFFGATISVYLPLIASLGASDVDIGKRIGISLVPVGLAYLIGSPITGTILGRDYTWWRGIIFASATMTSAVGCLMALKIIEWRKHRET